MQSTKKEMPYFKKALIALLPSALLSFMFFIWGSIEVYFSNPNDFPFPVKEALFPLVILFALSTVVLTLIIALFKGTWFRVLLGLVTGVSVASYVQNMFLNIDLGLFEGGLTDWTLFEYNNVPNALIYVGILLAVALAVVCVKKYYKNIVLGLSCLLLLMQGSAFAVSLASATNSSTLPKYVLNGDTQMNVSKNQNVIVFVLDYFANTYYDDVLDEYEEAKDYFTDFTYYNNCDPVYIGTFPSIAHLMTGKPFDMNVKIDAWFQSAWEGEKAGNFYSALKNNNFETRLFSRSPRALGLQFAGGKLDNLLDTEQLPVQTIVNQKQLMKCMTRLSCFRLFPHVLKKYVEIPAEEYLKISNTKVQGQENIVIDAQYYKKLKDTGLTVENSDKNLFMVQHLGGAHEPYILSKDVEEVKKSDLTTTAFASLKIVHEYIEVLKEKGLYDDATIIITSDHGDKENNMQVIYFIKEKGAKKEKMAVTNAPISHLDFEGTILTNAGLENVKKQNNLTSIYDFEEDDERERSVMRNFVDSQYKKVPKHNSTTFGTHNVMYEYTYEGDLKDLRKQIRRKPTAIYPLTESFN